MAEATYLLVKVPENAAGDISPIRKAIHEQGFEDAVIAPRQSLYFTKKDWEDADHLFAVGADRIKASEGGIEISTPTEIIPVAVLPKLRLHMFRSRGLEHIEVFGTTDFETAKNFAEPELAGMDWKHTVREDSVVFEEFPVEG